MKKMVFITLLASLGLSLTQGGMAYVESRPKKGVFHSARTIGSAISSAFKYKATACNFLYIKQIVAICGKAKSFVCGIPMLVGAIGVTKKLDVHSKAFKALHGATLAGSYITAVPLVCDAMKKYKVIQPLTRRMLKNSAINALTTSRAWRLSCGPVGKGLWAASCALETARQICEYGPRINAQLKKYKPTEEDIRETFATSVI